MLIVDRGQIDLLSEPDPFFAVLRSSRETTPSAANFVSSCRFRSAASIYTSVVNRSMKLWERHQRLGQVDLLTAPDPVFETRRKNF